MYASKKINKFQVELIQRFTFKYIIAIQVKEEETIMKAAREKQVIRYPESSIRLTADFSLATAETTRKKTVDQEAHI